MNPPEENTQIAPIGSDLYYSLLFTSELEKNALLNLEAFSKQLTQITEQYREKEIAQTKLLWWQQEWQRMFESQAQHPLAKNLEKIAITKNLSPDLFQEWIAAALAKLDNDHCCTEKDLVLLCYREKGLPFLLAAQVLGVNNKQSLEGVTLLAQTVCMTQILNSFSLAAHKGKCYLPLDWLTANEMTENDLQPLILTPALEKLFKQTIAFGQQALEEGIAKILPEDKKKLLPLIIQARLAYQLAQKFEKKQFAMLQEKIELLPIGKLVIALKERSL